MSGDVPGARCLPDFLRGSRKMGEPSGGEPPHRGAPMTEKPAPRGAARYRRRRCGPGALAQTGRRAAPRFSDQVPPVAVPAARRNVGLMVVSVSPPDQRDRLLALHC